MQEPTLYIWKGCRTCAKVLQSMGDLRASFRLVELSSSRLSEQELRELLREARLSPSQALRRKHTLYAQLAGRSEEEKLRAMLRDHSLIERPIIRAQGKAAVVKDEAQLRAFLEAVGLARGAGRAERPQQRAGQL